MTLTTLKNGKVFTQTNLMPKCKTTPMVIRYKLAVTVTVMVITIGMVITKGTPTITFTTRIVDNTTLPTNGTREPDGVLILATLLQSLIQTHILKVHTTITIIKVGVKVTGIE